MNKYRRKKTPYLSVIMTLCISSGFLMAFQLYMLGIELQNEKMFV